MNPLNFPYTPDMIDKAWLAEVLGANSGEEVADFTLTRIGTDQGASALLYRVDIAWHEAPNQTNPPHLPAQVVLKLASPDSAYRQYAQKMGTYLKEARFYQNFGDDPALPVPRAYFAAIDPASGYFLLVLEDLSGARMAKWFGSRVDDVQLALDFLAQIHARFWDDRSLAGLSWLGRADDVEQSERYRALLEQSLPAAKDQFDSLLSDYAWTVLETWLTHWDAVRVATAFGAKTLVHREADMRQMFFPTPALGRFVLFDWQSPEVGWGAADVGRMITTSLNLEQRRLHELNLVARYQQELQQHGVQIELATLWRQIKLSHLMNVLAHLFTLLWVQTEETETWQRAHLSMLAAALEDWQLLDLIADCRTAAG
ncbi:MAG: hypothetical protein AAF529_08810 [Pseudomonadota bacterium]